jgi:endoglucanase
MGSRAALAAMMALAIGMAGGIAPASAESGDSFDADPNLVRNPDFTIDYEGWSAYGVTGAAEGGVFCGEYFGPHQNEYDAGFGFNGMTFPAGDYFASFDAKSEVAFIAKVQQSGGAYARLGTINVPPSDTMQHYEMSFSSDVPFQYGEYHFHVGTPEAGPHTFCVDNVVLKVHPKDYVAGGGFSDGLGAWSVAGATAAVSDAVVCLAVPAGTSASDDVSLRLTNIALPKFSYALDRDASGTGVPMRVLVTSHDDPSVVYADTAETPASAMTTSSSYFALPGKGDRKLDGDSVDVSFEFGGGAAGQVCLDNIALLSGGQPPAYEPETGPRVRVNQLGYEPDGSKRATLVTDATDPVAWRLVDAAGTTAAEGMSVPFGGDASTRLVVQTIDFSDVTAEGTYTLAADDDESYPFVIATDLYGTLRDDALGYFYLARSGIDIDAAIVGDDYARAAGHVSAAGGSDTNQGDYGVACQPAGDSDAIYGEPWTCDYTLDVVGGWYDAGDHGKYVVNGGIATYQLLAAYERSLRAHGDARDALGDSTLKLPEVGNGTPDVLDEAKWELDFMLSMQVPEGDQYAGMVHHKVHDFGWTSLPLMPADDDYTRYLHRPSTAATLNLAATAAQGARLFKKYDGDYADTLLKAAETAWDAAVKNPELYAPAKDGTAGGGAYDDAHVNDEFYWAAAELYLTTGASKYEDYLLASTLNAADVFSVAGFDWGHTAALGKLDLATVDSDLPGRDALIASVVTGADALLAVQAEQAFGQALGADDFVWGSNAKVLNNQVVLATAYDLTSDPKYLDAVQGSMDYLLGRNALNQSYVTGYGTVFSQNQHSRWYAAQMDPTFPHPPTGSVAGGPNGGADSWDPVIKGLYPKKDCAPQMCYVDDIESYSTNEIAVNWNSALSWVAAFLAEPEAPVVPGGGVGGLLWLWIVVGGLLFAAAVVLVRKRRGKSATDAAPTAKVAPAAKAVPAKSAPAKAAPAKVTPAAKATPAKRPKA